MVLYEVHPTIDFGTVAWCVGVLLAVLIPAFIFKMCKVLNLPCSDAFRYEVRKGQYCFLAFLSIPLVIVVLSRIFGWSESWSDIMERYHSGDYRIVEGYVENFETSKIPYKGGESFVVGGVLFEYNDQEPWDGYHYPQYAYHDVIKGNGQYLRIGYWENPEERFDKSIVYIEEREPPDD